MTATGYKVKYSAGGPRLLGHKSEHRVRPCVHDIFSSSGGVRIHRFMHDVKFMFQNGVWQGEME